MGTDPYREGDSARQIETGLIQDDHLNQPEEIEMNPDQADHDQLAKLRLVLDVAKSNGNQLFVENIEREITALEQGQPSPIVEEYLTAEERDLRGV